MFKKIVIILFFLFVGFIYLHNLTRDIYSGDIGDLVTAAVVGGVPHPPGYPLFTFLGFILLRLPLYTAPVTKVGLISVFASLAGLVLLYLYSKKVTKSVFLSLLTVSILAFSYLFWLHAEIPEVFALNNFFVIAIIFFAVRFYKEKNIRDLYILSFLIGLSLTHHHTILLIFPGILLLTVVNWKIVLFKNRNNIQYKKIFFLALLFLSGISVYLYVPIAASGQPVINWDNAVNLKNFIQLIFRKDYGGFAPSVFNGVPTTVKTILAKDFLKTLFSLYSVQIIAVAVIGMVSLFKKDRWLLFSMLATFLISGPIFIFYSASVITTTTAWGVNERFYLLSTVVFIFFLPYGFLFIKQFIDKPVSNVKLTYVLLSYFLIIPYFLFTANFPKTNLAKTQIGNNLASDILSYLPKDAVLFVSGDTTTFNLWYARYALNKRQDVDIINPGGVGGNSFLDREINAYYEKNPKTRLNEVIDKTIEKIREKRKIFATYDLTISIKGSRFIPKGLVYELTPTEKLPSKVEYLKDLESQWKKMHLARRERLTPAEQNLVTPEIPIIYSNGLIRVADFLVSEYDDASKAEYYYRRAQWIDTDNPGGHAGLGLALYKAYKDCKNSASQIKEAISLYPIWKKYYLQLYILYSECNGYEKEKKDLANLYNDNFNEDLIKVIDKQLKKTEK